MDENIIIKEIKKILKKERIEILEYANEENECALSFYYNGSYCYITDDGKVYFDNLNEEDQTYIKKIIFYVRNKCNIDKELPILNINENNTEQIQIKNKTYNLLIKMKNQLLLYKNNNLLGIEYIICEQKQISPNKYIYRNINIFNNLLLAEEFFNKRVKFQMKPYNIFENEELKTILYIIDNNKFYTKSQKMKDQIEIIKNKCLEQLKT